MSTRTLPKSLHTITALVNVARFLMETQNVKPRAAMNGALVLLKLDPLSDDYGLADKALAQLKPKEG